MKTYLACPLLMVRMGLCDRVLTATSRRIHLPNRHIRFSTRMNTIDDQGHSG